MVLLITLGALLYQPSQYDALCYRVPRMLHWMAGGGWHWIHAGDQRMNFSAVNFEWITMPILVLSRSYRWLWIPNLISFALLPGLTFGLFRSLGFSRRAAWSWMWILPAGFCFVTQAGSIGNDLVAVPLAMGGVFFALRSRERGASNLFLAILSASLLTGIKASNLPLLLPMAVAAWPSLPLLLKRPLHTVVVLVVACGISFLPMALLNFHHTGTWTGNPDNSDKMQLSSPLVGLIGNGAMIALASFQPPILPNGNMFAPLISKLLGHDGMVLLDREFPRCNLHLGELPMEESAGLGVGITIVLAIAILLQRVVPFKTIVETRPTRWILIAAWIALGVYMIKMGSESAARLIQPYYPICLAGIWLFLVRRQQVVRLMAWRATAVIAFLLAILVLVVIPARPLWPALIVLEKASQHSPSPTLQRAMSVYLTYRNRSEALYSVRNALPKKAKVVAIANGGGDLESGLWLPLGSRKVLNLLPSDSPDNLRALGVEALCISDRTLQDPWKMSAEEFANHFGGIITARPKATQVISWGEQNWYVISLPLLAKQETE
jgi:hypothetical protein